MVFKNLGVLVLWTNIASALEGLKLNRNIPSRCLQINASSRSNFKSTGYSFESTQQDLSNEYQHGRDYRNFACIRRTHI